MSDSAHDVALPPRAASLGDGDGRTRALRRLYEEHADLVRSLLARLLGPSGEIEDVTHDVFLIAWRRPARTGISERAWLCGIAVKLAQAARRRARVRRFLGLAAVADLPGHATPATVFEAQETSRIVYAALERLSEKRRTVFVLFELQEMSGAEIAQALGCPMATVRSRLFDARRDFEVEIRRWSAAEEARVAGRG